LGHVICQHYQIPQGSIHIRCDNQSSLRVFGEGFVPNPCDDSFDIINAIWHMMKESPIRWTAEWIKGHQDDRGVVSDRFALLNCDMDALAKLYRQNLLQADPNYTAPQVSMYAEGWSVWCGDEKLHSPSTETLYDRIYAPKLIKYWTTTNYLQPSPRLSPQSILLVDWDAVELLMNALTPS
jgi:hypothetical protein